MKVKMDYEIGDIVIVGDDTSASTIVKINGDTYYCQNAFDRVTPALKNNIRPTLGEMCRAFKNQFE